MKNSIYELNDIVRDYKPNLVFLSEPQLYQCDANNVFQYLEGEYCWHLNSADLNDPELPLMKSRAHGGTAALWQKDLDPYIEVVTTTTRLGHHMIKFKFLLTT